MALPRHERAKPQKYGLTKNRLNKDVKTVLTKCGFFANIPAHSGRTLDVRLEHMRSTTFKQRLLAALIGAVLTLPAALSFAAAPAGKLKDAVASARTSAMQEMAMSGDLIESWSDYALNSLKSNFTWAREPGEAAVEAPTIFTRTRSNWARTPAARFPETSVEGAKAFNVAMQTAHVSDSPIYTAAADTGSLLPEQSPGLRRTIVAPSFTQPLDNIGYWRFSLILAYQKFDLFAPMQGMQSAFEPNNWARAENPSALRSKENSAGFGSRLDVGGRLREGLDWRAGYQSRVAMDNFYTYRGVFGQAGSFDIPPSANVGVDWAPVRNVRLSADVERIMYSQIKPFAGYSLPADFFSFLQGSGRPLAWENLDVYSVSAAWRSSAGEFALRYSTREQPLPTMLALRQLLEFNNLASHDWELDYGLTLGERSLFRFRALYAPIQLLGIPSYTAESNYGANRMRYEALLTTTF